MRVEVSFSNSADILLSLNTSTELTCNNMDAFAQSTALFMDGNPLSYEKFTPIVLVGEEFTRTVTSSMPSFSNKDHPSSANPLTASLKPL